MTFLHSNLLSTRTRRSSIFQQPPTWGVNRTTIPAAISALVIGIFFSYVPVLYVTRPPSARPSPVYPLTLIASSAITSSRLATYPRNISSSL